MGNDLLKDGKRVLQRNGIYYQFWTKVVNLLKGGEALRVVEKTHASGVHFVDGTFVVKAQYVGKEASHFAGTEDKYSHLLYYTLFIYKLNFVLLLLAKA